MLSDHEIQLTHKQKFGGVGVVSIATAFFVPLMATNYSPDAEEDKKVVAYCSIVYCI